MRPIFTYGTLYVLAVFLAAAMFTPTLRSALFDPPAPIAFADAGVFDVKHVIFPGAGVELAEMTGALDNYPAHDARNKARTWVAFVAPVQDGTPVLYIAHASPRLQFRVSGPFSIDPARIGLSWENDTLLTFSATSSSGAWERYAVDLASQTSFARPEDQSAPLPHAPELDAGI